MNPSYHEKDYPPIEIDVGAFLSKNGIEPESHGHQVRFKCPFSEHQNDKPGEYGFTMSKDTTQYYCHKCKEKGNIFTLCKKLGWDLPEGLKNELTAKPRAKSRPRNDTEPLSDKNKIYLRSRGISDEITELASIREKRHKGSWYLSIPVYTCLGDLEGHKLRQFPELGDKKIWEESKVKAQLYGLNIIEKHPTLGRTILCITEGELDALAVMSQGYAAVSGTGGANTWQNDWCEFIKDYENIYVIYDNDKAGKEGSRRVAESLWKVKGTGVNIVNLPTDGPGKDIGEYIQAGVTIEYITNNYAREYPEKISTEGFTEMGVAEIAEALDPIIKYDVITKVTLLVAAIGVFTEKHVINVAMNGGSSTGKTYNAKNIVDLFPPENVFILGNASKRAFVHMNGGSYDKETNTVTIDFENKIILLLDAPSTEMMETLRSFMSQDAKEITFAITDKSESGGQKTKNIKLRGPAMFVICTAGLHRDEQESTRLLVLSPEVSQDKSRMAIEYKLREAGDHTGFRSSTIEHSSIHMLRNRILSIKHQRIRQVDTPNTEYMQEVYFKNSRSLQPRHARDFVRFKALVAGFALLNHPWRQKRDTETLLATEFDIEQAGILWQELSEPQELGVPPQILTLYREIIVPAYNEEHEVNGVTVKDIKMKYFAVHNSDINDKYLRGQIFPTLETAGLIEQSKDTKDKRILRITPIYGVENNSSAEVEGKIVEQQASAPFEDIPELTPTKHANDLESIEASMFEEDYRSMSLDYDEANDPMYGVNS